MPTYDGQRFNPPAPIAYVTLRDEASGAFVPDVPLLIDTGADITLLPVAVVQQLGVELTEAKFGLTGYDGNRGSTRIARLTLELDGLSFRGEFAIIDNQIGILGRNILNNLSILLNGSVIMPLRVVEDRFGFDLPGRRVTRVVENGALDQFF